MSRKNKLFLKCKSAKRKMHYSENFIYVFLSWELRRLSPYFHIHVSFSVYIFSGSVHIVSCSRISSSIVGIYKSLTDT